MSPTRSCLALLTVTVATCTIGAAIGEVLPADDFSAILSERWSAAYHSGDATTLSGIYAPDARVQHGYCSPVSGREAIEEFWRADLGAGVPETRLIVEDSFMQGDFAYLSGRYSVATAAGLDTDSSIGGTYTQIWRRDTQAGWSILRESWMNFACADITIRPGQPGDGATTGDRSGLSV